MIGHTRTVSLAGLTGHVVDVEAHIAASLPAFTILGLPDVALAETRDRVRAAVASSGLTWPNRRVAVNLSPASLPKAGASTDLAIAVAVLAGAGLVTAPEAAKAVHLGELGLDGSVRACRGILPAVTAAVSAGCRRVVVPIDNETEAKLVPGAEVVGVRSLGEVARLYGNATARLAPPPVAPVPTRLADDAAPLDLADVRGQEPATHALVVAAAGGHHLLMVGTPGTGKAMLATRLPGLLPDMSDDDARTVSAVHSLAGTFDANEGLLARPPFEAPHHAASAAAILGGGSALARPGAISRAHAGVLFLENAPEFPARVLQTLRQPLEEGAVVLHRSLGATRFPARFQICMTATPCPCGYFAGGEDGCTCTPIARRRYLGRLSGPLLDRVELHVATTVVERNARAHTTTADAAARVLAARDAAAARLSGEGCTTNAQASARWLRATTPRTAIAAIDSALDKGVITARGADRTLRVAWTLADLRGGEAPAKQDVAHALELRRPSLD